jgi:hypothetical protein
MAKAFVKTFKRDYVRVNPIPDAATALNLIDRWMEDYNTVHPHSGWASADPAWPRTRATDACGERRHWCSALLADPASEVRRRHAHAGSAEKRVQVHRYRSCGH